ncbi:M28 family peptidase [Thalassotalea sp. PS06]|uniref:M28 family peptidase n=1 Tax=Thalassotalea sp. PS06 TaxID=2594005 RepID=UPI0021B1388C|nr:M28 family peptidase [Thalassotalea sp. PS06]
MINKRICAAVSWCWLSSATVFACNDLGENAWSHLQYLAGEEMQGRGPGQPGHLNAQAYISSILKPLATSKLEAQSFTYQSGFSQKNGTNWVLNANQQMPLNANILVIAHYDHLGTKGKKTYWGADDNASGTAALLALATCMAPQKWQHNFIFIAVDREEQGLRGAKAFIDANPQILNNTRALVNLDMIAHGVNNRHYWLVGTERWSPLKETMVLANNRARVPFKAKRRLPVQHSSRHTHRIDLHKASDHYEFYKAGIPYLFVTGDNHQYYHTQRDSIATIDPGFYQQGVHAIAELIVTLDAHLASLDNPTADNPVTP